MKNKINKEIKFIDLFSGLGGTRIGLEQACKKLKIKSKCVLTSEIKPHAIQCYQDNFKNSKIYGDITKVSEKKIPDFDILLGGFPCQSFSSAGNRRGFLDTRGTLFFEIERILKRKKPSSFILENVEGLVAHDRVDRKKPIGRTLETIILTLEKIGYKVTWKIFNAIDFNVPQNRKRIFIVGNLKEKINLNEIKTSKKNPKFSDIMESIKVNYQSPFQLKLLKMFKEKELYGKSIKDKRGGSENIHSWDLELKGKINKIQKRLLSEILTQRRRKIWAQKKKIQWMDGMALTLSDIESFFCTPDLFNKSINKSKLKKELDDLVNKGYLTKEYPKESVKKIINNFEVNIRQQDETLSIGYNIVVGKLSFEISKIIDPNGVTPTLLATDMNKLQVIDNKKLRKLSVREGLRLFGFPEKYNINLPDSKAYNLLGESIVVPIVKKIAEKIFLKN